ncbi:hypothetical protein ACHQM5_003831 [Ranunculus cassubicifolius]
MADEFQSGICSGNWWNSSPRRGATSVPCSTTINEIASFSGWMSSEMIDMKVRSSEESVSVSDSSMVFQDGQKPQGSDSVSGGGGCGNNSNILMDSTLQMMGFGLSTPMDWNQATILNRNSGRTDNNFQPMLQEEMSSSSRQNYLQENMMESSRTFSGNSGDSSLAYKQMDHNRLNSGNSSDSCIVTCQGLPTSYSMDSTVPYGYQTPFLQGLFDQPDLQQPMMNYSNYSANEAPHSWQKLPPKQQVTSNQLHFSNNTPFWNPSASSITSNSRPSFPPPLQNQFFAHSFEEKPNCSNYSVKVSSQPRPNEVRDAVKKVNNEVPPLKRPRIETPSPLPTFKVRKEKLGDRVTALQQLVSPFGKTDTASVLFEAIEYIKFLHEQVLSAPYMKNGAPTQHQQQNTDKSKDKEGPQQDLRSRGLCLVPMASIFPVTNETSADFWTPTFGGTYR